MNVHLSPNFLSPLLRISRERRRPRSVCDVHARLIFYNPTSINAAFHCVSSSRTRFQFDNETKWNAALIERAFIAEFPISFPRTSSSLPGVWRS